MRIALFLPPNCDFITLMDIDTWLRRLATYLQALECPPVTVVGIICGDVVDAVRQVLQVEGVALHVDALVERPVENQAAFRAAQDAGVVKGSWHVWQR